jgi:hypothetical protein
MGRMPLDLSDAELATAATACRALAYQEGERAKQLENPTLRGPLEDNAKRYAALAQKLEAARTRRTQRLNCASRWRFRLWSNPKYPLSCSLHGHALGCGSYTATRAAIGLREAYSWQSQPPSCA